MVKGNFTARDPAPQTLPVRFLASASMWKRHARSIFS
jgi:hypothetical protein